LDALCKSSFSRAGSKKYGPGPYRTAVNFCRSSCNLEVMIDIFVSQLRMLPSIGPSDPLGDDENSFQSRGLQ
jgi:hypothetical protein